MKSESLLKVLTGAGTGSRRRMAEAIKHDRVLVNGQVVEDFRHPVNIETDLVVVDGRKINLNPEPVVTLLLHKPAGVLSTARDERGRRTVIDLLPGEYRRRRLYPVGRLDKDSTGLLLLTNDGELAYQLTHPRFEIEKEYLLHIADDLKSEAKRRLETGIRLEDGMTHPAKVKKVTSRPPFNYSLAIHEGRKRQVRRMLESLGHHVIALKRTRMGNLKLGDLPEGNLRELTARERRALLNQS
ncbi:MAG: rRNA pseudouridine synthase [Chloroflexi bacterium]|nr:rRNA pseudouridine synthase [Chloroflexota bacterium]